MLAQNLQNVSVQPFKGICCMLGKYTEGSVPNINRSVTYGILKVVMLKNNN